MTLTIGDDFFAGCGGRLVMRRGIQYNEHVNILNECAFSPVLAGVLNSGCLPD